MSETRLLELAEELEYESLVYLCQHDSKSVYDMYNPTPE